MIDSPLLLSRPSAHQCPQRHQGPDGNVLVIHQMFLRERQRFHDGAGLVLGLRVHHEDDALAIAARIPPADFPVEVGFTVARISAGMTAMSGQG